MNLSPITEILIALAGGLGGTLTWWFLKLIGNISSAPVKLYREREAEAFRNTWRDIRIETYLFPPEYHIGIGLRIIVNKPVRYSDIPNIDVSMGIDARIASIQKGQMPRENLDSKLPLLNKSV